MTRTSQRRVTKPLVVAAMLILSGCDDLVNPDIPPDGSLVVDLQTDKSQYRFGGGATVVMTNRTDARLFVRFCEDALERLEGAQWVEVVSEPGPCIEIAVFLEPRGQGKLVFDLDPATRPGTYRLRRPFSAFSDAGEVKSFRRSNSFSVVR